MSALSNIRNFPASVVQPTGQAQRCSLLYPSLDEK
jgi:hypothetical protein